ncbi:hypothetical protein OHS33_38705 (plasmid) [Streptomyces sp. NBC_00536]|uniref:hypothetical protein n=1 Tax=Streptomyces sp. NBC_00536 TaxID=2975769 RepID=UPI002E805852|nr:hypothetical protein [Streptomyces sp. NBC_00536]WUC84434.1 hypothetical protein OHS33_38705 [Streptomyces sp. NBC_00536]
MTTTRKTTTPTSEPDNELTATPEPATVIGPPLREGQAPEKVRFAHHLWIAGRDYLPGETALISPDYARQLRGNGYIARERG